MNVNTDRGYYCGNIDKSLHAERNVLLQYAKQIMKSNNWYNESSPIKNKSTMYVFRLHGVTEIGCSKPCKNCEKILYKHGIKVIKYTDIIDNNHVICTMKICK